MGEGADALCYLPGYSLFSNFFSLYHAHHLGHRWGILRLGRRYFISEAVTE